VTDGTVDLLAVRVQSALDTCLPIAIGVVPRDSFATSCNRRRARSSF
jgi:hypothetical protein